MADCNRAIELNPKYAVAYNYRGLVKQDKGDFEGALADYARAIEINPKYAEAYANRAGAKDDHGDLEEAAADFSRVALSTRNRRHSS